MDNQHRKISGYRELTAEEIEAMNAVKAVGAQVETLLNSLASVPGVDQRALAIAKTDLQTGFMWAVRAIAKPQGF